MGNKTVGIFTVSSTTAKTASRSLNHCLSIPTLCPCSRVLAEAFLRLCHERLGKWSGCTFPCHLSSCWGIPAAQLTDKLLQLNACLLLTPASLQKTHPCLFWFISQKNAREGNEGGDSLNLHWRLNCKNSEKASQQLNPIWINITALRTSTSQPYAHTSSQHWQTPTCVAKWFRVLNSWDLSLCSFVRGVSSSDGLLHLTTLVVQSDKQSVSSRQKAVTERREQSKNITARAANNFNHFKLSLVRIQHKKMRHQPKINFCQLETAAIRALCCSEAVRVSSFRKYYVPYLLIVSSISQMLIKLQSTGK